MEKMENGKTHPNKKYEIKNNFLKFRMTQSKFHIKFPIMKNQHNDIFSLKLKLIGLPPKNKKIICNIVPYPFYFDVGNDNVFRTGNPLSNKFMLIRIIRI